MGERLLLRGNEVIAEAAIRAGCQCYFAYPITPQAELLEHMARHMPRLGRTFIQAESEIAAVSMVYGAAGAGVRAMTSSSSPGISLKQEGISYLAGAGLPCVIVNIVRGGPGLGNIAPSQCDYFQATKGGGHGDYRLIVLGPSTVPEAGELTTLAFDLADQYRIPVMILADGLLGQMMEPVELPDPIDPASLPSKEWATTGAKGRAPNIVLSFEMDPDDLKQMNLDLQSKYRTITENEIRFEESEAEDAEIIAIMLHEISHVWKYYQLEELSIEENEIDSEVRAWRQASEWANLGIHDPELARKISLAASDAEFQDRLAYLLLRLLDRYDL